jgi:hypothetical protein
MIKFSIKYICLFIIIISIGLSSCSDDNSLEESRVKQVKIYLTDDPLDAEEVNVEILSIILKGKGSEEIELNTLSGIYNLLDFTGDLDTLIASGNYDLNNIKEIILILGDENTIKIDNQLYLLNIPNDRKAIKIKVDIDLSENVLFDLLIDFDACESIKEVNGIYTLSPVIRFKGNRNNKTIDKSVIVGLASCYEIQFPVKVLTVSDEVIFIDDLETLVLSYDDGSIFGVQYPLLVANSNGNIETIHNGNQAEKLIKNCGLEEEGKDLAGIIEQAQKCFEVVFPLSVIDLNNMVLIMDNFDVLKSTEGLKDFEYPLFLKTPNGDSIAINNINQLEGRIKNCKDGEVDGIDVKTILDSLSACYTLEYPIKIKLEDGTSLEIFSIEELNMLNSNPYGIIFPIYILEGNTDQTKISNLQQVKRLLEDCDNESIAEFDVLEILSRLENCAQILFPITGIKKDGETYEIDSLIEIYTMDVKTVSVQFPFYIIDKAGIEMPINNLDDLWDQIKNCGDNEEIEFENLVALVDSCYKFVFPLQVVIKTDSSVLTISNIDELWQAINDYEVYTFVYPIVIIDADSKDKRINNTQQLKAQSKKCERDKENLIKEISNCYEFKFPVKVITLGQDELVANNLEDLYKYWETYDNLKFDYPLFLLNKNGDVKEIKNKGNLNDALKNCE